MAKKRSQIAYTALAENAAGYSRIPPGRFCNSNPRECNRVLLVNAQKAPTGDELRLISLANSFRVTNDGWMVVDYGEYPHPDGYVQVLDKAAAVEMVNWIETEKAQDPDWPGIRVSIGHPGHPGFRETDDAAYAWIKVARADAGEAALKLQPDWSEEGVKLRNSKKYVYFSPEWDCTLIAGNRVRPCRITAVGLTNRPIIKVRPLANAQANEGRNIMNRLLELLGLAGDATEDQAVEALQALQTKAAELETIVSEQDANLTTVNGEKATLTTEKAELETKVQEGEVALVNARKEHAGVLLDIAAQDGRVPPGARKAWEGDFEKDYDGTMVKLSNAKPVMRIGSETQSQGGRGKGESQREQILTLVNAEKQKLGDVPDAHRKATLNVKAKHPDLFATE